MADWHAFTMDSIIRESLADIRRSMPLDFFDGKSVLISGGAGFLGSWLCDILTTAGSRISCLDNLSTGVFDNIRHLNRIRGFRFVKADVCSFRAKDKFDLAFHLASRPAPEDYQKHPVDTALANSAGTHRMLESSRKNDARVFFASSSEVYGDPKIFPTPESYEGRVNPIGPRSCYEEGKRFGESLCKAYHDEHGLDVRIGRIFNSYGPRLRAEGSYARVVSRFIHQSINRDDVTVYGNGSQTRSFCFVSDTVAALLLMMKRDGLSGRALNIGSQEETRIIDLARKIIRLSSSSSRVSLKPFPAGDHRRRVPDIRETRRTIRWTPKLRLEEGLKQTVKWFLRKSS